MRWFALTFFCISAFAADPQLATLLQQGDAEVSQHNLRAALAHFQAAEKIEPNSIDVLLRIAQQESDLIANAKSPAEAQQLARSSLDHAQRAVALAQQNAKAHLSLAIAYGRLTDFENNRTKIEYSRYVKAEAEKAAALDPHEDYAYHVLGVWNCRVANLSRLMKFMARVIYGGVPEASNEEAVRNFQKAIELAPQRILHHQQLANVYTIMGKRDLAQKEWETILALPALNAEDEKAQVEAKAALATSFPSPGAQH